MGKAIFSISNQLLCDVLRLPEGTQVGAVFLEGLDQYLGQFRVLVESPDLPNIPEGAVIPEVTPAWKREVEEGYKIEFIAWDSWGGVPKP